MKYQPGLYGKPKHEDGMEVIRTNGKHFSCLYKVMSSYDLRTLMSTYEGQFWLVDRGAPFCLPVEFLEAGDG